LVIGYWILGKGKGKMIEPRHARRGEGERTSNVEH